VTECGERQSFFQVDIFVHGVYSPTSEPPINRLLKTAPLLITDGWTTFDDCTYKKINQRNQAVEIHRSPLAWTLAGVPARMRFLRK
jgi:hypothetical protein